MADQHPPVPFTTTKKPRDPRWRWVLAIAAALVATFALGAALGDNDDTPSQDEAAATTATTAADKPTTTARPTTTTTSTTSTTTTTTTPPTTTTTIDPRAELEADMAAWSAEAYPKIDQLSTDLAEVGAAAGEMDLSRLNMACQSLSDSVEAAADLPAAPDDMVETPWRLALDEYWNAADKCVRGTVGAPDAVLFEEVAGHMARGANFVDEATTQLQTHLD